MRKPRRQPDVTHPQSIIWGVILSVLACALFLVSGRLALAGAGSNDELPPNLTDTTGTMTSTQYLPVVLGGTGLARPPTSTPTPVPPTATPVAAEAMFSAASYGATITDTLEGQTVQCLGQTWLGLGHNHQGATYSTIRLFLAFPPVPAGVTGLTLRLHNAGTLGTPFDVEVRQGQWSAAPPEEQVDCLAYWRRPPELGPVWGTFTATSTLTDTIDVPLTVAPVANMPIRLTLRLGAEADEPLPGGNGIQVSQAELFYVRQASRKEK